MKSSVASDCKRSEANVADALLRKDTNYASDSVRMGGVLAFNLKAFWSSFYASHT